MAGQKRTRSGELKPQNAAQDPDITMTNTTPPCAQPPRPSTTTTDTHTASTITTTPSLQPQSLPTEPSQPTKSTNSTKPPRQSPTNTTTNPKHTKMRPLPQTATVSKRPLLHPALPTPYASSASPKVLYITASTPYISCLKRVRKLLAEIEKRGKQSSVAASRNTRGGPRGRGGHAEANGRLAAAAVERDIAEGVRGEDGRGGKGGEEVFLKATGRAIARALEIGVFFQGEGGVAVRVQMGSVRAVDDVEVGGEVEEDVPETRIRTLSSVTVSIGMK